MIEIQRNLFVLRRWWWLILAATVLGGLIAFAATKLLIAQSYVATAVISVAPPPQGPNGLYVTALSATADAQLISTRITSGAALHLLPPAQAASIQATELASKVTGNPSLDGQLIFVSVTWRPAALAASLANAVAQAYIGQEKRRLLARRQIIHTRLQAQQQADAKLIARTSASGAASAWLHAQYAEDANKLAQTDTDTAIQADLQASALQISQPASVADTTKAGPKASINALLGAGLGFLLSVVFAFISTTNYPAAAGESLRPVLSSRAD